MEHKSKIEIKAEPYKNITFKTERGVPVLCKEGKLTVTARGDRDTTSVYAYDSDNNIVGKVNVLSYDKVTRKICLVPVGDTKAPDASTVKQGLDEIFAKLMVDFDVTIGEPITIQYAKNNKFTHGGSGIVGVYNADQKAAISKLKERGVDNETCYLFLVKECIALKDNDTQDAVSGYMPRGYQFGFIYNQVNNVHTMAHELCHGAFHLKHTFAADDFLAPERGTDNLMDYAYGQPKTLNHWQWKDIHQPKSVRFKWLQDEDGAEYNVDITYDDDEYYFGSESILKHLIANKNEIINLIDKCDKQLNKYLAAEYLIQFFENEGVNVIIQNYDEAYNYLLQIIMIHIYGNREQIAESIHENSSDIEIIQSIQNVTKTVKVIEQYHSQIADIIRFYLKMKKVSIEEVRQDLKATVNSVENVAIKSSIISKMSNKQFKLLLRNKGHYNHKEVRELVELKRSNLSKLLEDSRFLYVVEQTDSKQLYKEIDTYNNQEALFVHIINSKDQKLTAKYSKILSSISKVGTMLDIACAMEKMAKGDVSPLDILVILPSSSLLISQMMEYSFPKNEEFTWTLTWNKIVGVDNKNDNDDSKYFLQYTTPKGKINYNVSPTSIILTDLISIKKVFDLQDQSIFVNYSDTEDFSHYKGQIQLTR